MKNTTLSSPEVGCDELARASVSSTIGSRRAILQGLMALPLVVGEASYVFALPPAKAAAANDGGPEPRLALGGSDGDDAIVAKAREVRCLLTQEKDALDVASDIYEKLDEQLGPMPELDRRAVDRECIAVLEQFAHNKTSTDPTIDGLKAMKARRIELHAKHEVALAEWHANQERLRESSGFAQAYDRENAAMDASANAMGELASMASKTVVGIAAKASIFKAPFSFDEEMFSSHMDLAISILRDLGCAIAPRAAEA